jgi:hypothetical protein
MRAKVGGLGQGLVRHEPVKQRALVFPPEQGRSPDDHSRQS